MRVLLLRHTAVAASAGGICYGRRDVPLSAEGRRGARALCLSLPVEEFGMVIASPLRRARWLGGLLARRRQVGLGVAAELAERDFGVWEGQSLDAVHAEVGAAMDGILDAPETYRPGGGETTSALGRRVMGWFEGLPRGASVLAVAHGGPIGALAGMLRGEAPRDWLGHVPRLGEGVLIERVGGGWRVGRWPG